MFEEFDFIRVSDCIKLMLGVLGATCEVKTVRITPRSI